jgi:hypothetical protein
MERLMGHPPKLKLVWDGGKIVKNCDNITGAKIWRCDHCCNIWPGWNHMKALGHGMVEGGETSGLHKGTTCLDKALSWHFPS